MKNKISKPKVLVLAQLPPPIHGVSVMNSYIVNNDTIHENFEIKLIDLKFVKSLEQLQKFSLSKVFYALKYSFYIIKEMILFKPKLVYFTFVPTGFGFYRDAFYIFLLKIFKTNILIHLHGKGIKENNNTFLKRSIYKYVFHKIDVICISEILSKDISDVFSEKPYIIHNGVSEHPFRRSLDSYNKNNVPQILYLSNYTVNKGIFELIKALGILKKKGYNFIARFVGAPFDITMEQLEQFIVEQNLKDVALVVGPLSGNDKFLEFKKADLFVHPTYSDAFPLVILEAMQFGLPVISTFEGGIPDMVINNETSILVESQNLPLLVEKIAYLLDNKNIRIEMGRKGYERFKDKFTLSQFITNINITFQEILGSK